MLFPVSGVETSVLVPPLVAFVVSFFTSMGGISGAFLLLPFQMSVLNYTSPSVSATNQVFNIVAIPSGVYRYLKEKRMVWPLAITIACGTLPGVFLGALIRVTWLPDPRPFKLFAGCVLLYIGVRLIRDLLTGKGSKPGSGKKFSGEFSVAIQEFSLRKISYSFLNESYECSTKAIFFLSLFIGIIGGTYGIGGGAIMSPFLVAWFRLPVHTISGATLMGTFLTSIAGVAFYSLIAAFHPDQAISPDWLLGFLFGLGGFAGMYCGARCQKLVPANAIKWMLGLIIAGTALKYIFGYFF